jgi:hypothetical protein
MAPQQQEFCLLSCFPNSRKNIIINKIKTLNCSFDNFLFNNIIFQKVDKSNHPYCNILWITEEVTNLCNLENAVN